MCFDEQDLNGQKNLKIGHDSLEFDLYLTRQLVLCKHGILRGSNCCSDYMPKNKMYPNHFCCLYCANSIWIGNEKSAMNPFAALEGDPVYAIEVLREEFPDINSKKARI